MDWLTFSLVLLTICVGAHHVGEAIKAWREVRLADAANLRHAVDAGNESDDEIVGEHVTLPGRTH